MFAAMSRSHFGMLLTMHAGLASTNSRRRLHQFMLTIMAVALTRPSFFGSTNCLQTGSECVYPFTEPALSSNASPSASTSEAETRTSTSTFNFEQTLNDYAGGSFHELPDGSKTLLRYCLLPDPRHLTGTELTLSLCHKLPSMRPQGDKLCLQMKNL